ncbi:MAG: AAA family ATPase [Acidimicrobiaceae bacterium]|nr:AAA family ATPase [Acidimicrobiaceae bacterium]
MDEVNFDWHLTSSFAGQSAELALLDRWWQDPSTTTMVVSGPVGSGKSWLVRQFAHHKDATVVPCRRISVGAQLEKIRATLSLKPTDSESSNTLSGLIAELMEQRSDHKSLLIIDDFNWLLPTGGSTVDEELARLRKTIISRKASSPLKLLFVVEDSSVADTLVAEKPANSGVIQGLEMSSLSLSNAGSLLQGSDPFERFTLMSVSGGLISRVAIFGASDLRRVVVDEVLTPGGALWETGEVPITASLREPRIYFSILEELAAGDRLIAELSPAIHLETGPTSKYLNTLETIGLVERRLPVGAPPLSRNGHWRLKDGFLRFYFRFVFPNKEKIIDGLSPEDLYDSVIAPDLMRGVEIDFQDWATSWTRRSHSFIAPIAGPWWPSVKPDFRRKQSRRTEGLTIVGFDETQITMAGEAIWSNQPMGEEVVRDLRDKRLPLLAGAGYEQEFPPILILFSRAGYTDELKNAARTDESLVLVDVGLEMTREAAQR